MWNTTALLCAYHQDMRAGREEEDKKNNRNYHKEFSALVAAVESFGKLQGRNRPDNC